MKILVLGGYGNFGARICRALAPDPRIQLFVGGRDLQRAEAFAERLGHGAVGCRIDLQSQLLAEELRELGVQLVVHTAGPFQEQGYEVARSAATAGAHYIDIADGRRFVCDFEAAVDSAFRAANRFAVTGASTVPALSAAVVDDLCAGWKRIDSIDTCIAPAQTAPRGRATMAAVLQYCGEPIQVWDGGSWQMHRGWAAPSPVAFERLTSRLGALCDIPDLELFPERYVGVSNVMFRAAVEVPLAQRVFAWLAALRRAGLLPRLDRFAGVLNLMARALDPFGSPLGGMVVQVRGLDATGTAIARSWHIAAGNDHGPEIPCMAAILLARRLAAGETFRAGAGPCAGLLTLAEFGPEFQRWGMLTGVVTDAADPGVQTVQTH